MTVKQAINIIDRNTDKIFNVIIVDGLIDGKVVASHQDDDDHRWYTTATRVYQVEDGFIGVRGLYKNLSKTQSWKDLAEQEGEYIDVFEVEPVPDVYYKRKH